MSTKPPSQCDIGAFGHFKHGGKWLMDTWLALEAVTYECDWWIGIYNQHNLLDYARDRGLLKPDEIETIQGVMAF